MQSCERTGNRRLEQSEETYLMNCQEAETAKNCLRCGGEESRGKSVREEEGRRKGSACKSACSVSRAGRLSLKAQHLCKKPGMVHVPVCQNWREDIGRSWELLGSWTSPDRELLVSE